MGEPEDMKTAALGKTKPAVRAVLVFMTGLLVACGQQPSESVEPETAASPIRTRLLTG